MAVAYQQHFYRIYSSASTPSDKRITIASIYGNTINITICGIIGVMGYGTYGNDNIHANFIESLSQFSQSEGAEFLVVTQALLAVSLLLISPELIFDIQLRVYKLVTIAILRKQFGNELASLTSRTEQQKLQQIVYLQMKNDKYIFKSVSSAKIYLTKVVLFIVLFCLAFYVRSSIDLCTWVACVGGCTINFVIPNVLLIKAAKNK